MQNVESPRTPSDVPEEDLWKRLRLTGEPEELLKASLAAMRQKHPQAKNYSIYHRVMEEIERRRQKKA